jgi:hypothetical protein
MLGVRNVINLIADAAESLLKHISHEVAVDGVNLIVGFDVLDETIERTVPEKVNADELCIFMDDEATAI